MDDSSISIKNEGSISPDHPDDPAVQFIREAFVDIASTLAGHDFAEAREKFIGRIAQLQHKITSADPGHELRDISVLVFELTLLGYSIGFSGPPITLEHRSGANNTDLHVFRLHPPDCGTVYDQVIAVGFVGKQELPLSVVVPSSDRKRHTTRLDEWALAAKSQQPSQWCPIKASDLDLNTVVLDNIEDQLRGRSTVIIESPKSNTDQDSGDANGHISQSATTQTSSTMPTSCSFLPSKDQLFLLRILGKAHRLYLQTDLEQATGDRENRMSRKTIGRKLKPLLQAGLIEYPQGSKGGVRISDAGSALLLAELASH